MSNLCTLNVCAWLTDGAARLAAAIMVSRSPRPLFRLFVRSWRIGFMRCLLVMVGPSVIPQAEFYASIHLLKNDAERIARGLDTFGRLRIVGEQYLELCEDVFPVLD